MKLDRRIDVEGLRDVPTRSRELAADGFDGLWTAETKHDPFFPLLMAAEHTEAEVGTAIAVAFARNPMIVANVGRDLQDASEGRFILGLGTQVQAHITRRFGMPWSRPVSRVSEFVRALQAIWTSWNEGTRLKFEGDFYTYNLMTPYFNPGPGQYGNPRVFLAAVGAKMAEASAEVGDGCIMHVFQTPKYLHELLLPAIERGLAKSGKARSDFEVKVAVFVVAGDTPADLEKAAASIRKEIAFYASTPAYRPVLEIHGWGHLQDQLQEMTRSGQWEAMGDLISDEVLAEFAVICKPEDVVSEVRRRYGDVIDRLGFHIPYDETLSYPKRIAAGRS